MVTVILSLLNILALGFVAFFSGRLYQQARERQLRLEELDEIVKGMKKNLSDMEALNIVSSELLGKAKGVASDLEQTIRETKEE